MKSRSLGVVLSVSLALLASLPTYAQEAPGAGRPHDAKRDHARKRPPAEQLGVHVEPYTVPEYTYTVVGSWPHDPNAFTQGLIYLDGVFYESTGLNGASSVRRVDPQTGNVLQRRDLSPAYFGEGLTEFGGKLYQLTWLSQTCFVYDRATFTPLGQFSYEGEGWGITHDGRSLIMSDGTDEIRFLDPETFAERRRIRVRANGVPVVRLNELEYIKGQIYANVWLTDEIVRIDPWSGWVTGRIDLTGLLPPGTGHVDVLNGIAYDAATDRLFLTGKLWPRVFEVRLRRK
jgi:glutamine cyclotransferase